jgi:signal transduction histidine kinase
MKQAGAADVLLETLVHERTSALSRANEKLRKEIAARHRLEKEILEISEREQRRIGRDLHNDLGQCLVGISYMGLRIMNYRANVIGGALAFSTSENGGAIVICAVSTTP